MTETPTPVPTIETLDDVRKHLNKLLFRTVQYFSFQHRNETLEETLAVVERVLTSDLTHAVRENEALKERIAVLEAERTTVRAFFGVGLSRVDAD